MAHGGEVLGVLSMVLILDLYRFVRRFGCKNRKSFFSWGMDGGNRR